MELAAIQSFLSLFLLGFVTSIVVRQLVVLSLILSYDKSGKGAWRGALVRFAISSLVLAALLSVLVLPTMWEMIAILFGVLIATTPAILEGKALLKALKGH